MFVVGTRVSAWAPRHPLVAAGAPSSAGQRSPAVLGVIGAAEAPGRPISTAGAPGRAGRRPFAVVGSAAGAPCWAGYRPPVSSYAGS